MSTETIAQRHTPGPWRAKGSGIEARAFDGSWKWLTPTIHGGTPEQATANRTLMVASPDLLEALQEALHIIQTWHSIHDTNDDAWEIYLNHAPEMKRLRTALAKAEGREPS